MDVMKNSFDPLELTAVMNEVHHAGMPGVFAGVRDNGRIE
jgi:hypothetical protein